MYYEFLNVKFVSKLVQLDVVLVHLEIQFVNEIVHFLSL